MKFSSGNLQKFDHLVETLKECQKKVLKMATSEHAALLKQMEENRNCLQHHLETVTQYNRTAEGLLSCADDIVFLEVGKKMCVSVHWENVAVIVCLIQFLCQNIQLGSEYQKPATSEASSWVFFTLYMHLKC